VRWQELTLASEALRGNPLGDPHERPLFVWAPEGDGPFPAVYVLNAHMRSGRSWFNVDPFERSFPEEVEALAPRCVVVLVDGWTSVGGSQWIDSDGIGRYGSYLAEAVSLVDSRFGTVRSARGRGLQGKSSGGYGAIVNALLRPDLFGAAAAHAPDALFEVTQARGFAPAARALRERSYAAFWEEFRGLDSGETALLVELYACALAYSGGELPWRPETGEVVPEVLERWLAWDPVRLVAAHADALRGLRGLWLDAGNRDSYFLDAGAIALRSACLEAGLPEERLRFELFDGGHGGMSWRYPLSLAWLVEQLDSSNSP
jgi:S-formylglutathione hydrolase FrmB